jgi:hypothetical protein
MLNFLKVNDRVFGNNSTKVNFCLYVVLHVNEATVLSFGASTEIGLPIIVLLVTKNKLSPGVLVCSLVFSVSDVIYFQM